MSGTGEPSLPSRYSGTRVAYRGSILFRQYGAATVHHTSDFNEDFGERAVKGVRHGFTTLPRSGEELAVSHPPAQARRS